jgi:hypothetical protein
MPIHSPVAIHPLNKMVYRQNDTDIRCDVIIAGEWVIFGGKRLPSRCQAAAKPLPSLEDTTSDLCCDDIKTVAFQSGQLIRLLIEEAQAGFVILSSLI